MRWKLFALMMALFVTMASVGWAHEPAARALAHADSPGGQNGPLPCPLLEAIVPDHFGVDPEAVTFRNEASVQVAAKARRFTVSVTITDDPAENREQTLELARKLVDQL